MPNLPGVRSCYDKVGRVVYFGRMVDKIRVHAAGTLPADYVPNLGDAQSGVFDARCCRFLRVAYSQIREQVLAGKSDEEVLAWAETQGGRRSDGECECWNGFMMKRGWHDNAENYARLQKRIADSGLQGRGIETFFDYIDLDEGRDSIAARRWESV